MNKAFLTFAFLLLTSAFASANTSTGAAAPVTCLTVKKMGTYGIGSYYNTQCTTWDHIGYSKDPEAVQKNMWALPLIGSFRDETLIIHSNDPKLINSPRVCAVLNWKRLTTSPIAKLFNPKSARYMSHYRVECELGELSLKDTEFASYLQQQNLTESSLISFDIKSGLMTESHYFSELGYQLSSEPKIILIAD